MTFPAHVLEGEGGIATKVTKVLRPSHELQTFRTGASTENQDSASKKVRAKGDSTRLAGATNQLDQEKPQLAHEALTVPVTLVARPQPGSRPLSMPLPKSRLPGNHRN